MEKYIKNNYLILVDTSFILDNKFILFFRKTLGKLRQYNQKLVIPKEVINEIIKVRSEGKITNEQYSEVMHLLSEYKNHGELVIVKESKHKIHTDNLFVSKITELRLRKDIVLLTNDKGLIDDTKNLKKSSSTNFIKDIKIYSLLSNKRKNKKIITSQSYLVKKEANRKSNRNIDFISVEDKNPYVTETGEMINNYLEINKGGEGKIYLWNNKLIKIYHREEIQKDLIEKIRLLKNLKKKKGIAAPQELVYNHKGEFIGFTMKNIENSITLDSYLKKIFIKKYNPSRIDLVNICLKLCKITKKLHNQGVFIGDWNLKNLLINPSTLEVNLIDVDSFQIGDFPCPVAATGFLDPDFIKALNGEKISTYFRTEANEMFSLNIILFQILMLGKAPFARKGNDNIENNNYHFPYRFNSSKEKEPEGSWKYIWHNFSFLLKETFYNTFKNGERYDIDWWTYILNGYRYNIEQKINSNKLIETSLKNNKLDILN